MAWLYFQCHQLLNVSFRDGTLSCPCPQTADLVLGKRIDLLDEYSIGKSLVVGGLEYGEFCGYAVAGIAVLPQEQFEIPQERKVNLIETDIERTESRQMRTQHPMLAGRRVFAERFQPFDYLLQIVAN